MRAASLRRDPHLVKRLLASAAATALALGGLLVATAAPASAHTPQISASCSTLSVKLTQYPAKSNDVTVTVDGKILEKAQFTGRFEKSYPLDGTTSHTWSVAVDAPDGKDGTQYDVTKSGTTEACDVPDDDSVQVAVYVYPKLRADQPAAWENSGLQRIVTSAEIDRPANPRDKAGWLVQPLTLETVLQAVPQVELDELCTAWGVQQDLVDLPGGLEDVPREVQYSKDGKHLNPFPEGTLIEWDHAELVDLLPAGSCDDRPTPGPTPGKTATPTVPDALTTCEAELTEDNLPSDSAEIVYSPTADGVLAELTDDNLTFSPDTAQLGYVVAPDGRSAVFPLEKLQPGDEACALVPGTIEAVCQGDVPYLGYEVALPAGVTVDDENPLTITFLHPSGGESYVMTDQPLSGTILWPGASAEEPRQWPGFVRNDDGSYTETEGNYAWTRDGVEVLFEVNPSYSKVVSYPPTTSACANPPVAPVAVENVAGPAEPAGPALATTGATVAGAAAFAALLVGGGALVFWLRRRVQS